MESILSSIMSPAHPLGDDAIRVESQGRGSPHIHSVLWIKDAPKNMALIAMRKCVNL